MLKQCFNLIMLVKFPMFGTFCWFCCCCCCCCCFCCCRCCYWCCSWSHVCPPPHHQSEPLACVTPMPFVFWLPPCVCMISLGYCNGCCWNPGVVDLISMLCLLVQSHVWLIKSHMQYIYIYIYALYMYIRIIYIYIRIIYIYVLYIYIYVLCKYIYMCIPGYIYIYIYIYSPCNPIHPHVSLLFNGTSLAAVAAARRQVAENLWDYWQTLQESTGALWGGSARWYQPVRMCFCFFFVSFIMVYMVIYQYQYIYIYIVSCQL